MQDWNGVVSLFLACMELVLLANVLIFAKGSRVKNTASLMLILLLVYQSLEFLMCGMIFQSSVFPFTAFAVISFLPPLNLILITRIFKVLEKQVMMLLIIPAAFLIYYFIVIEQFSVTECAVIYAAYSYPLGDLFGFFYYLPIIISIFLLIRSLLKDSEPDKKAIQIILLSANIIITVPVLIAFILKAGGYDGLLNIIESVMCKFAFFYALALAAVSLLYPEEKNE